MNHLPSYMKTSATALVLLLTLALSLVSASVHAQDKKAELANAYYQQGEYEKSAMLYKKLATQTPSNMQHFERYIYSLRSLEDYDAALAAIDERKKAQGMEPRLVVLQGELYTTMGDNQAAKETYTAAIEGLQPRTGDIIQLASAFNKARNYRMAMNAYEHGATIMQDTQQFIYQLRNLAQYNNDIDRIVTYALMGMSKNPQKQLPNTKAILTRYIDRDQQPKLQTEIYKYIRVYPDQGAYQELLIWSMLAQDNFAGALRQARAMDRKYDENGSRIYTLAQSAMNHRDYDSAVKALEYILENKGRTNAYYPIAKADLLRCRRQKILADGGGIDELRTLVPDYEAYFAQEGKTAASAYVLLSYARFQNTYLKDADKAIEVLEELVAVPNVKPFMVADAKMELGDLYLLKGDRWEATLRYAQVDKDHPEDDLGEQARYKNALLSYYVGDFAWAQEQFDILKASTSKVIANDAIDRSVFITASMGLDSTDAPLKQYANADLLIFQRRYDKAMRALDGLLADFPAHDLEDDVYFLRAQAYEDQQDYVSARSAYLRVAHDFAEDIRADNSIYALAELYQHHFEDELTAAKLYEVLFLAHRDSTFAITARKRYRALIDAYGSERIDAEGRTIEQLYQELLSQ